MDKKLPPGGLPGDVARHQLPPEPPVRGRPRRSEVVDTRPPGTGLRPVQMRQPSPPRRREPESKGRPPESGASFGAASVFEQPPLSAAKTRISIDAKIKELLAALAHGPDIDVSTIVGNLRQAFGERPHLRLQDVIAEQLQGMEEPELQALHSALAQRLLQPNCGAAIQSTQNSVVLVLERRSIDAQVKELLTALAAGPDKDVDAIGVNLRRAFSENPTLRLQDVIAEQLQTMTVLQLRTLHSALAQRLLQANPGAAIQSTQNSVVLALERLNPALSPTLQGLLGEAFELTSVDHYAKGVGKAMELCRDPQWEQLSPYAIVADAIAYLLENGVAMAKVEAVFRELPGNELIAAAKPDNSNGHKDREKVVKAAHDVSLRRGEEARDRFVIRISELAGWPRDESSTLGKFADHMIQAANHLTDFQLYSGKANPLSADERDDLEKALKWFCEPNNLGATGENGLSISQLKNASVAIGRLGFAEFKAEVDGELEKRRTAELTANTSLTTMQVIKAVQAVGKGSSLSTAVTAIRNAIVERSRSRAKTGLDFSEELREQVAKLPKGERDALAVQMRGGGLPELRVALRELRHAAVCQTYPSLRAELHGIESVLVAVRSAADPSFNARVDAKANAIARFVDLGNDVIDALHVCGKGIERHIWSARAGKNYLMPVIAAEATSAGANRTLALDFRKFLKNEHSEENFLFMEALNRVNDRPNLKQAKELIEKFISESAKQQINVDAAMRGAIEQAFAVAKKTKSADALKSLHETLVPARVEIDKLTTRDSLSRFRKAMETSARAEAPPAPDQRQWALVAKTIGLELTALSTTWFPEDGVTSSAQALSRTMPRDSARHPDYWSEFYGQAEAFLRTMPATRLAALLYNLESVLAPELRHDDHVYFVRSAANDLLIGTCEARMTVESVLLARAVHTMDVNQIGVWLDRQLVNEEQVAEAFEGLTRGKLELMIANRDKAYDVRLVAIAAKVLPNVQAPRFGPRKSDIDVKQPPSPVAQSTPALATFPEPQDSDDDGVPLPPPLDEP